MEKVKFIIRQALKIIGGGLVGAQLIVQDDVTSALASVEGVFGSLMIAAGVGISIWNQIKANIGKISEPETQEGK